jgi:hypothetical protein
MTVGTHTWSHKDLARNPYAKHLEQAEQEVEMVLLLPTIRMMSGRTLFVMT